MVNYLIYHVLLNLDSLGFHDMWTLPNSFGKIYVGETFTSYISLHNFSYHAVFSNRPSMIVDF